MMGLGRLGSTEVIFRKKFRWMVELFSHDEKEVYLERTFCRAIHDEERQSVVFTICVTYVKEFVKLYEYLGDIFEINNLSEQEVIECFEQRPELCCICKFRVYDGDDIVESWVMRNCRMKSISFGELDHSSSECVDLTISITYKHCARNDNPE